jgi:ribosomal protein L18E
LPNESITVILPQNVQYRALIRNGILIPTPTTERIELANGLIKITSTTLTTQESEYNFAAITTNGELKFHSGNSSSRNQIPPSERCTSSKPMKVALTTGNNLYYSRILSSIYMPDELFLSDAMLKKKELEKDKQKAMDEDRFVDAERINNEIKEIIKATENQNNAETTELQKDIIYRFEEFRALSKKTQDEINVDRVNEHLKVKDVTKNIEGTLLSKYFSRILRIDNMKITSAQLDFSRVVPVDSDADGIISKNIFRS